MPPDTRVYKRTFSYRTTRYVGWEVHLAHPSQTDRIEYEIEYVLHRPNGTSIRETTDAHIEAGWTATTRTMWRGFRQPSQWATGLYKVELFIDEQLVASGEFEIVDSPLPTEGPFGDLRQSLRWNTWQPSVDEEKALSALLGLMEIDPSLATLVASLPWVQHVPTDEGRGALQLFDILAREDLDLAKIVIGFPWLADDVTKDEWLTLRTLTLLAVRDVAWARFISDFDSLNDGITEDERRALAYLHSITIEHPSLAETLLSLPWLHDDLTADERWALLYIWDLAREDASMAHLILSFPWLYDDLTEDEKWVVLEVRDLARIDLSIAQLILSSPWLVDDVTADERSALRYIWDLAREDASMAHLILSFPWLYDDLTEDEKWVVLDVRDLARIDLSIAQLILSFPWLVDDVTKDERWALRYIWGIAEEDASIAQLILSFPWLADDVTKDERWALRYIWGIAEEDASIAQLILSFPWLADDVTKDERWALRYIWNIAEEDLIPVEVVLGYSWLADGVNRDESTILLWLRDLTRLAPRVGVSVAKMEFLQGPIAQFHRGTIYSVLELYEKHPDQAAQLTALPWFANGLDYHEAALVLILPEIAEAETLFGELVPTRAARSQLTNLPLAGDIKMTLVRRPSIQPGPDTFNVMGEGLGVIEDFMNVPWPNLNVVLLLEPELELAQDDPPAGFYSYSHMVIDTPENTSGFPSILYHELGHYYLNSRGFPIWLSESGADFLEFYVNEQRHQMNPIAYKGLVQRGIEEDCAPHDIANIQDLVEATEELAYKDVQQLPLWLCHYEIGEMFLLYLYESFGRESVSGALRNLYLLAESERRRVTEAEIYRAFLANTPPGKKAEFYDLYERFHGGPIPSP